MDNEATPLQNVNSRKPDQVVDKLDSLLAEQKRTNDLLAALLRMYEVPLAVVVTA